MDNANENAAAEPATQNTASAPEPAIAPETAPAQEPRPPLTHCPHCGRKLLTSMSILCNWCGEKIDVEEYQERAAQERAARDEHEREAVEREMEETRRRGVLGRLKKTGQGTREVAPELQDIARKFGPSGW